jgi:acyl carrier protein
MNDTFGVIADVIARITDVPRESIRRDSNVIDDLGIDSLDFLDIVYELDREFGIHIPTDDWIKEINDGKATSSEYFKLQNFSDRIEALVEEKRAQSS